MSKLGKALGKGNAYVVEMEVTGETKACVSKRAAFSWGQVILNILQEMEVFCLNGWKSSGVSKTDMPLGR